MQTGIAITVPAVAIVIQTYFEMAGIGGYDTSAVFFGASALMFMAWVWAWGWPGAERDLYPRFIGLSPFGLWPVAVVMMWVGIHDAFIGWDFEKAATPFYEPAWWATAGIAGWVRGCVSGLILVAGYTINYKAQRTYA